MHKWNNTCIKNVNPLIFNRLPKDVMSLQSHQSGFPGDSAPVQETRVWSLGQKDSLEKGMATHCNILALRNPWTRSMQATVHGSKDSDTTEQLTHTHTHTHTHPSSLLYLNIVSPFFLLCFILLFFFMN